MGGAVYNTFAPVTHQVPLESLHDSFSQEELREFDRRVREAVGEVEYVVEPKFDGLSVALEYRDGLFVQGLHRGTASPAGTSRRTSALSAPCPRPCGSPTQFRRSGARGTGPTRASSASVPGRSCWRRSLLKTLATLRRAPCARRTRRSPPSGN
ncbi:MAG: hypothetical protein ACLTEG_04395 [Acutalibacter sp.]